MSDNIYLWKKLLQFRRTLSVKYTQIHLKECSENFSVLTALLLLDMIFIFYLNHSPFQTVCKPHAPQVSSCKEGHQQEPITSLLNVLHLTWSRRQIFHKTCSAVNMATSYQGCNNIIGLVQLLKTEIRPCTVWFVLHIDWYRSQQLNFPLLSPPDQLSAPDPLGWGHLLGWSQWCSRQV